MRINEIAFELHFTDESHLNRIFKKYKGMSPTGYRKQVMFDRKMVVAATAYS
jgi:AraC-like DNA-binding protein